MSVRRSVTLIAVTLALRREKALDLTIGRSGVHSWASAHRGSRIGSPFKPRRVYGFIVIDSNGRRHSVNSGGGLECQRVLAGPGTSTIPEETRVQSIALHVW